MELSVNNVWPNSESVSLLERKILSSNPVAELLNFSVSYSTMGRNLRERRNIEN